MKVSGLWILYLVVGTALMFLNCSPVTTCLAIAARTATIILLLAVSPYAQEFLAISCILCFCLHKLSPSVDVVLTDSSGSMTMAATSRKLKDNGYNLNGDVKSNAHVVNLEDYHPIDPVPSSKASIKPGPIEHGTPLNPYIPKPSPPSPGLPKLLG